MKTLLNISVIFMTMLALVAIILRSVDYATYLMILAVFFQLLYMEHK